MKDKNPNGLGKVIQHLAAVAVIANSWHYLATPFWIIVTAIILLIVGLKEF